MDPETNVLPGPNSDHFGEVAKRFANRAKLFYTISIVLLAATGLLIGVGILVFLFPTYITDVADEEDTNLSKMLELLDERAQSQSKLESAYKMKVAVAPFKAIHDKATNTLARWDKSSPPIVSKGIKQDAVSILNVVDTDGDVVVEFGRRENGLIVNAYPYGYYLEGEERLDRETLLWLNKTIQRSGHTVEELKNLFSMLPDTPLGPTTIPGRPERPQSESPMPLPQPGSSDRPSPPPPPELSQPEPSHNDSVNRERSVPHRESAPPHDTTELKETFERAHVQLAWAADAFEKASVNLASAQEEDDRVAKRNPEVMKTIVRILDQEIDRATLDIIDRRAGFLEQWLPVISIRVCVVFLLLFLTRILLATYRFTTSVSLFFRARADALAFVRRQSEDEDFDIAGYSAFLVALTPPHEIGAVESPERYLLSVFRPSVDLPAPLSNLPSSEDKEIGSS